MRNAQLRTHNVERRMRRSIRTRPGTLPPGLRKLRLRHAVQAAAAVAVSVTVHALALRELPRLPGWLLSAGQTAERYPAIRLDEVRLRPPEPQREPAPRIRPEDPDGMEALLAAWMPPEEEAGFLAEAVPGMPDERPLEEAGPLADAAPAPESASRWEDRQEILAIQEKLLSDDVAARPRTLTPAVSRVADAGDIVLPLETVSGDGSPSLPAEGGGGGAAVSALSGEGPPLFSGENETDGPGDPGPDLPDLPDTGVFDESPGDVSEATPVEDLLSLDVTAYRAPSEDALYFRLEILRRTETRLPVLPRDVLLIQDCSESMTPWKLAECRRGLRRWLERLSPGDRLEVVGFRDAVDRAFGAWRPVDRAAVREAGAFIDAMRSEGDTDVFGSLQAALETPRSDTRPTLAVLITDGRPTTGVTASSEIIDRITRQNRGELSIFTVGAGKRVNSFFLDLLSYRNRGGSVVVETDEDIDLAMDELARQISRPVLTGLRYRFTGVENEAIFPRTLTHLYLDRPLVLYGKAPVDAESLAFQIVGQSGEESYDLVYEVDLGRAVSGDADLRQAWARQLIYDRIGAYIQEPTPERLEDIRALSRTYGMLLPYGFSDAVPR